MSEEINLPLSALNTLPTVSGIDDVSFEIPTDEDIRETIRDERPSPEDLEEIAKEGATEGFEEVVSDAGGMSSDVEVSGPVDDVDVSIDGFFGPTESDLEGVIDTLTDALGGGGAGGGLDLSGVAGIVEDVLSDRRPFGDVAVGDLDADRLEQLARGQVTDPEIPAETAINALIDRGSRAPGAPGPREELAADAVQDLAEDGIISESRAEAAGIAVGGIGATIEAVADAIDTILNLGVPGGPDLFDDPVGFYEAILSAVLPSVNGESVLFDPVAFVIEVGVEISEISVDPETRDNLDDAIEAFSAPDIDEGVSEPGGGGGRGGGGATFTRD